MQVNFYNFACHLFVQPLNADLPFNLPITCLMVASLLCYALMNDLRVLFQ